MHGLGDPCEHAAEHFGRILAAGEAAGDLGERVKERPARIRQVRCRSRRRRCGARRLVARSGMNQGAARVEGRANLGRQGEADKMTEPLREPLPEPLEIHRAERSIVQTIARSSPLTPDHPAVVRPHRSLEADVTQCGEHVPHRHVAEA